MNKDANHINKYSADDFHRYWNNEMSATEMNALERAAVDDPFLADALEGYSKLQKDPAEDLAFLRSKVKARTVAATVVPMKRNNGWLKIAAAIIIIGGLGLITLKIVNEQNPEFAQQKALHDSSGIASAKSPHSTIIDSNQSLATTRPGTVSEKNSGIPAEERKGLVRDHVRGTLNKKNADTTLKKGLDYDYANAEKQSAAPPVAMADDNRGRATQQQAAPSKPAESDKYINAASASTQIFLNSFSGKVIDAQNRVVANATVFMTNTKQGTLTDQNGFFQFQSKDSVADISVNVAGYDQVNLRLNSNQSSLITLDKETPGKLKEVSEYKPKASNRRQEENKDLKVYVMDAEPTIGWDKYNQYLDINKKIPPNSTPITGEVVLSFKVNRDGELSSFTVEQSLNKDYDNEAIRLVKEGPVWKVTKGKKARVKLIVHF